MELHITNSVGSELQFKTKMILFTSLFLTFARADDSGKISDGVRRDRQTVTGGIVIPTGSARSGTLGIISPLSLKYISRVPVDDSRMCQYAISSSIK